jgi:hypothetical protein
MLLLLLALEKEQAYVLWHAKRRQREIEMTAENRPSATAPIRDLLVQMSRIVCLMQAMLPPEVVPAAPSSRPANQLSPPTARTRTRGKQLEPRWSDLPIPAGTPWRYKPCKGEMYEGRTLGSDRVEWQGRDLSYSKMGRATTGWKGAQVYPQIEFLIDDVWLGAETLRAGIRSRRSTH